MVHPAERYCAGVVWLLAVGSAAIDLKVVLVVGFGSVPLLVGLADLARFSANEGEILDILNPSPVRSQWRGSALP